MNGKQLKNSILQWAIQGKLVPQDHNDEPASVLLEKIRQEKEHLIKEKKIKRDKNASIIYRGEDNSYYEKILATGEVKCIDEEIPFEVPQGWEWERFGNVMINKDSERIPLSVAQRQHLKKTYDYYGASGVIDKVDKYLFDKDLLLIGEDGANLINRSTPIAFIAKGKYWVNNHAHVLDVCSGMALSYVALFINAISLVDYVTGTAQPKMNQEKMNSILLAIPPVKEQHRILEKMSKVDAFVDKYASLQTKLDSLDNSVYELLRKSILQEAIQGKLVPQIAKEGTAQELLEQIKVEKEKLVKEGKLKKSVLNDSVIFRGDDNKYWEKSGDSIVCIDEEIPFGIPSSWSWCRLGNIASVKGGKRIPVGEKLTTENTGHMYIRVADMKENTVKTDDIHYISESIYQKIKSYTISTEDLYITVAGTIGSVGEIPKVFDNANLTENADKIVFRGICKKFLMYCLLSNFVQSQIKKCTTKVGQPKLAIVRIEDLLIPLPPIKEQYRIVHKIEQTASIMSR
ncbi:restriction endonuclease subunit S [Bacteroides ovatus]|nr:restriction endonuclease subunit S [Bacteroides ovatus]MCE8933992.1 restriction endonuclease subunit S [Bacteroides ovatus]